MAGLSTNTLKPILKWAGGKRKVLPAIRPLIPENFVRYFEPFLGGGAVLFDLMPSSAVVSDVNSELINMYEVIRDSPKDLIQQLSKFENSSDFYYAIRDWDRKPSAYQRRSPVAKAARTIYLNRTGYNGLYRVNSKNQHNVPFGKYKNPLICDQELIVDMSNFLLTNNIKIRNEDFSKAISRAKAGDFIYLDPPYAPLDNAASTFTSYTSGGFTLQDLGVLKECLDEATRKGAQWLMSNVSSAATRKLFPTNKYRVHNVQVGRPINSKLSGRGAVTEILVAPR